MATMSLAAAASPLTSTPRAIGAPAPRAAFLGLHPGAAQATRFTGLAMSSQPAEGRAAAVVAMAKREQELEEIRGMTTEQLEEEVVDLKGELFLLRLKRSARQEFKNSEFCRMRKRIKESCKTENGMKVVHCIQEILAWHRNIARMLTVKREREIEQGINKRLSRKLDRKWKQSIV
ncbi:50S ribosomal protein L29, chloroplastic, partial [Dichanthelium oligosanthes]